MSASPSPPAFLPADRLLPAPRPDRVVRELRLANGAVRREHYDFGGRLLLQEEPDGAWLRYHYGQDGQLAGVEASTGEGVTFGRDSAAREIRVVNERTETILRLDSSGLPAEMALRVNGRQWRVAYRRDPQGRVSSCLYPGAPNWLHLHRSMDPPGRRAGLKLSCGSQVYLAVDSDREAGYTAMRFTNGTETVEEFTLGRPPLLRRLAHREARGNAILDVSYDYDEQQRLCQAGDERFAYDQGRLAACLSKACHYSYTYDGSGRLVTTLKGDLRQDFSYNGAPMVCSLADSRGEQVDFTYDALGRRTARRGPDGVTRYAYNLFGQLERVELPGGRTIRFLYDGLGRLVGRETDESSRYYIVDLEGRRLAEADISGRILRSYLWLGLHCLGAVNGVLGEPLALSFHRRHGGRLAGLGFPDGRISLVPGSDPYGEDAPVMDGIPGYASLFGEPATRLLQAGARWFDPALAQFLTADSWYGTNFLGHLPEPWKTLLNFMPGGTDRVLSPETAYSWCAHDPVNFLDPQGHNWLGFIWGIISAFLWEIQLTSISLNMEVMNLLWEVLQWFPIFRPAWDWDGYRRTAVWNIAAPVASTRLMVPFAFVLNGWMRFHYDDDRCWTLGNVIWARGDKFRELEASSKRDLLLCGNASLYQAATQEAATPPAGGAGYMFRSPHATATAAVSANGLLVTGVTITAPAGAALADVLVANNWVAIRLPGAATDELRSLGTAPAGSPAGSFAINPALPVNYQGQAVNLARLDGSVARMEKNGKRIARAISFIRGQAIHIGARLPEGFPEDSLVVTEYMPAGVPNNRGANAPAGFDLIRLADAADQSLYAAANFIRIRSGTTYFPRQVLALRGTTDLLLDQALPAPTPPATYGTVEVLRLDASGTQALNQSGAGDRVEAGTLTDLQRFDGLTVENIGAPAPTLERFIVLELFLRLTIDPLPAALQGTAVEVDFLVPGAVEANGSVTAARRVTTVAGGAALFNNFSGQPVRVRTGPATDALAILDSVDVVNNQINLDTDLPPATFPNGTAVTVTLLQSSRQFEADNVSAPGDQVVVKVELPTDLAQNDLIRVRPAGSDTGGAVRRIIALPAVLAQLDRGLPATHTSNLTVRRFAPASATLRDNASAPAVQIRFTITAGTNPYNVGDFLYLAGGEQAFGRVLQVSGQDVFLEDPVEYLLNPTGITITEVAPTGVSSTDGRLDESLVLIPSDFSEDPVTRRRALELHEMQHVWQGAAWGPFLLSLPVPWLINLGFSFTKYDNSVSQVMRHISVGFIDTLMASLVWGVGWLAGKIGIGEGPTSAELQGTVKDGGRTLIALADTAEAKKINDYTRNSSITITKGDFKNLNFVKELDKANKEITLRKPLEENRFSQGDSVKVYVSDFEKIREIINKYFSLTPDRLWRDAIPVGWGRALSKILDRQSWLPGLGIYPLSLMVAGCNEDRLPNEQDAAYHSGDLYTSILLSNPREIHVGQFSRIFGFLHPRGGGQARVGLTDFGALNFLTVQLPAGGAVTDVAGGVDAGGGMARFRENYYISMHEKVENVVGALFAASRRASKAAGDTAPDTYVLRAPGDLAPGTDIVFKFAFSVSFLDLRQVTVKDLEVAPNFPAGDPLYETEEVLFQITGDDSAEYLLRYRTPAAPAAIINGRRFAAPVLAAGSGPVTHELEITATYPESHPVFQGPGQAGPVKLASEQRTNRCQNLDVTIAPLAAPAIGPVTAGTSTPFTMPIAPQSAAVTTPLPSGASVNARIVLGTGRPAELTFIAPDAVSAAVTVTFDMVFGSGASSKTVTVSVQVNPV